MKARVSEEGITIPKEYLAEADLVDIRLKHDCVIVTPIVTDPIRQSGTAPVDTYHQTTGHGNDQPSFSRRWRGKLVPQATNTSLDENPFSPEALEADPRLAYLVERYRL
ncbi:MAG: hypothetical protein KJO08_05450 [Gammaproteobacteria bacterium]|nr:hypothetical protein [Gammaproteobacteria bacterium]NNJ83371.1 hypothetical protein [Gammaproteobacteria bacterium]